MRPELYGVWNMMLARCFNPRHEYYADYGGRGVTVCRRWRRFRNFEADVGQRPPGCQLERMNNAGDYEPGNTIWATPRAQARNRRARRVNAPGTCSAAQERARWDMFGNCCWMCGAPATASDHVKPLAAGGTNWPANLRPACDTCNARKGTQWPWHIA